MLTLLIMVSSIAAIFIGVTIKQSFTIAGLQGQLQGWIANFRDANNDLRDKNHRIHQLERYNKRLLDHIAEGNGQPFATTPTTYPQTFVGQVRSSKKNK